MSFRPRSDVQRQDAARAVRFSPPVNAKAAITDFVQAEFAPFDDTWNNTRAELNLRLARERQTLTAANAAKAIVASNLRRLCMDLVDAAGRRDLDAIQQLFGAPVSEVLRLPMREMLATLERALPRLDMAPVDPVQLDALKASLPSWIAAQDALTAERLSVKAARQATMAARDRWDEAYTKLRQCVEFHTTGDEAKTYLLDFADARPADPELVDVSG